MITWAPVHFCWTRACNTIIFEMFVMVKTRTATVDTDNRTLHLGVKPYHHVRTPERVYIFLYPSTALGPVNIASDRDENFDLGVS